MKKILFTLIAILCIASTAAAQDTPGEHNRGKKRFSLKEFQERQRNFITTHAKLTPQEAEAFFPIFFELQKKKWLINKEARDKVNAKYGKEHSEEKCLLIVNEFADAKIKIAELEKEYITKYLEAVPASKILGIQRAEEHFQKETIRQMWERGRDKHHRQQRE